MTTDTCVTATRSHALANVNRHGSRRTLFARLPAEQRVLYGGKLQTDGLHLAPDRMFAAGPTAAGAAPGVADRLRQSGRLSTLGANRRATSTGLHPFYSVRTRPKGAAPEGNLTRDLRPTAGSLPVASQSTA